MPLGSLRWRLTVVVLAFACRADSPEARGATAQPVDESTVAVTQPAQDSLRLELLIPPRVRTGAVVGIKLRVQNRTQRALDLYLRGRTPTLDVVVARANGGVVWRRLQDEVIPAIALVRTLAPGEQFELEAAWDQRTNRGEPVEPGEYTAHGVLLAEEPLRTPAKSFLIVK